MAYEYLVTWIEKRKAKVVAKDEDEAVTEAMHDGGELLDWVDSDVKCIGPAEPYDDDRMDKDR